MPRSTFSLSFFEKYRRSQRSSPREFSEWTDQKVQDMKAIPMEASVTTLLPRRKNKTPEPGCRSELVRQVTVILAGRGGQNLQRHGDPFQFGPSQPKKLFPLTITSYAKDIVRSLIADTFSPIFVGFSQNKGAIDCYRTVLGPRSSVVEYALVSDTPIDGEGDSANDFVLNIYYARSRTQGNPVSTVQEPGPTPPMSARSGSNGMRYSGSILRAIPPRIVRVQLKHSIDERVPIQSPIITRNVFHTLRLGTVTLPLVLLLATYRYTISEDPEFIASNHDEFMEPVPMRIPCCCSPPQRQCYATYKTYSYRQYDDGWFSGASESYRDACLMAKEERLTKKLPNVRGITRGS
ncbi:hypothetical protein F5146DRAFT_997772 [Armillaria mellea]|nr:hypothetical protein F5146DRAFT_997772 [Armillaria mellea]